MQNKYTEKSNISESYISLEDFKKYLDESTTSINILINKKSELNSKWLEVPANVDKLIYCIENPSILEFFLRRETVESIEKFKHLIVRHLTDNYLGEIGKIKKILDEIVINYNLKPFVKDFTDQFYCEKSYNSNDSFSLEHMLCEILVMVGILEIDPYINDIEISKLDPLKDYVKYKLIGTESVFIKMRDYLNNLDKTDELECNTSTKKQSFKIQEDGTIPQNIVNIETLNIIKIDKGEFNSLYAILENSPDAKINIKSKQKNN